MDTPAGPDFRGGVKDLGTLEPVVPLRDHLDGDGTLTNTSPSRYRPILNFDPGELRWQDFFGDQSELSTDRVRYTWDIDGTLSYANPLFTTGANWKKVDLRGEKIIGIEANLLDVDLILWLHMDQTLSFRPELVVDLRFDPPVLVRASPQGAWVNSSVFTLPVDVAGNHHLEIVQPAGGVRITPTYSVRGNRFTNTTRDLLTLGYQESFLSAKIQGIIAEILLSALLPVDPEFAAFRATFANLPIETGSNAGAWTLAGFEDVKGDAITIEDPDA